MDTVASKITSTQRRALTPLISFSYMLTSFLSLSNLSNLQYAVLSSFETVSYCPNKIVTVGMLSEGYCPVPDPSPADRAAVSLFQSSFPREAQWLQQLATYTFLFVYVISFLSISLSQFFTLSFCFASNQPLCLLSISLCHMS